MEYVSRQHLADSFTVQKRTRIRNMIAQTANAASGVLVRDAASAFIRAIQPL
jgi:hypothetical protein